ncbi:hypothetical protein ABZ646_41475 [Streptomyces sp. NPDC007162]|uniref:hypothetical protein n=1 Tax=Streptomyces sp. NPDC007162 TaxID=3156917 RepID=UPI0033C8E214
MADDGWPGSHWRASAGVPIKAGTLTGGTPRARARRARFVVAPRRRLLYVLRVTVEGDRVTAYEVIADQARLRGPEPAVLDAPTVPTPSAP